MCLAARSKCCSLLELGHSMLRCLLLPCQQAWTEGSKQFVDKQCTDKGEEAEVGGHAILGVRLVRQPRVAPPKVLQEQLLADRLPVMPVRRTRIAIYDGLSERAVVA